MQVDGYLLSIMIAMVSFFLVKSYNKIQDTLDKMQETIEKLKIDIAKMQVYLDKHNINISSI